MRVFIVGIPGYAKSTLRSVTVNVLLCAHTFTCGVTSSLWVHGRETVWCLSIVQNCIHNQTFPTPYIPAMPSLRSEVHFQIINANLPQNCCKKVLLKLLFFLIKLTNFMSLTTQRWWLHQHDQKTNERPVYSSTSYSINSHFTITFNSRAECFRLNILYTNSEQYKRW